MKLPYKLSFLRVFNSPFKTPKIKFYAGKIKYGTPYFLPRKMIKSKTKPGYFEFKPKKIGFDLVGLGWKTKWSDTDYRFEWGPLLSFVFFKWQICLIISVPYPDQYWEAWLYYDRNTNQYRTKLAKILICMQEFPQTYIAHRANKPKETIDYYPLILKEKYIIPHLGKRKLI